MLTAGFRFQSGLHTFMWTLYTPLVLGFGRANLGGRQGD